MKLVDGGFFSLVVRSDCPLCSLICFKGDLNLTNCKGSVYGPKVDADSKTARLSLVGQWSEIKPVAEKLGKISQIKSMYNEKRGISFNKREGIDLQLSTGCSL
jgi:hypothetical protein